MIEVTLASTAREKVGEELRRHEHNFKTKPGFETGGWLWGRQGCGWWGGL
jgi:hypothetical protein